MLRKLIIFLFFVTLVTSFSHDAFAVPGAFCVDNSDCGLGEQCIQEACERNPSPTPRTSTTAPRTSTATSFNLPEGNPITFSRLDELLDNFYRFLVRVSSILMVATIIVAGIMWGTAGDSPRVEKAKAIFKAGVIGALIILGAGVLIRTVGYFVTQLGDPRAGSSTLRRSGESCSFNSQCASGICNPRSVCN